MRNNYIVPGAIICLGMICITVLAVNNAHAGYTATAVIIALIGAGGYVIMHST